MIHYFNKSTVEVPDELKAVALRAALLAVREYLKTDAFKFDPSTETDELHLIACSHSVPLLYELSSWLIPGAESLGVDGLTDHVETWLQDHAANANAPTCGILRRSRKVDKI